MLRKPHRDQALPPPHQVHVEKWPDIKSYSRLLLAKVREGRARNPTETLKETVTCGLQEKQSLVGRGFSAADSNTAFPSFPFCWWEEEIPPAHSGTGRKRKEVAQGKSLTQNHKPAISTPEGGMGVEKLCCQEASWPNVHHGVSKGHPSYHRPRPTLSVRE